MLKKKNIVMAMAATVVATSVAPAFADSLDGTTVSLADAEKMAELRAELKEIVELEYSKDARLKSARPGDRVHTVKISKNGGAEGPAITSYRDIEKAIEGLTRENDYITINVTESNGHNEVDGKIVDWVEDTYKTLTDINKIVAGGSVTKVNKNGKTAEVFMTNNDDPIYLTVGDVKLDFKAPIYKKDSAGNFLNKDGEIVGATSSERVVVGFEKDNTNGAPTNTYKGFTVEYAEVSEAEFTTTELLNPITGRLTKKGNELAKFISDYNRKVDKLVADSAPGFVIADKIDASDIEKNTNNIELTIDVPKNLETAKGIKTVGSFAQISIKGASSEISTLKDKFDEATTHGLETLAGSDRIQTAIEVSKDTFNKGGATNPSQNVVLVSDQVIADGLAATPFANAVNAPVLLTNKDAISSELMAEIERVLGNNGKVYLVGGESVLTTNLEKQLEGKYIDFERIAGADRQGTSLEIAKKIAKLNGASGIDRVFVAGGYAEADTMSVAGVAAMDANGAADTQVTPILLAGANGLTKEQSAWVKFNANNKPAYIIGGESHVSVDAEADINDLTTGTVKRIAGTGRQETNAKVIKEFYEDDDTNFAADSIDTVYITKSDNKGLVDALSTGVAAAKKKAPIVLATDELVSEQKSVLKELNSTSGDKEFKSSVEKKQTGYGIADKVWEAIQAIF